MKRIFAAVLMTLTIAALSMSCSQQQGLYPRQKKSVRIVSYNVGIFGKWDLSSEAYTAGLMHELNPDVIALQELDSCTTRKGVDLYQARKFAEEMGPQWDFTYASALESYKDGSYGIGLVWNTDVRNAVKTFKVMLPKGEATETRALDVVEYEDMVVASTHLNGHASSLQPSVEIITDTMKGLYGTSDKPVFLCGDFNARPDNPSICFMRENWTILTPEGATGVGGKNRGVVPAPQTIEEVKGGCIDYIMCLKNNAKVELVDAQICFRFETGDVFESSDHLPVFADVRF